MIRAGDIRRGLIIGADTLSRISDPHDRDSMIYADGAGAAILEARDTDSGILAHASRSDTLDHSGMLSMGRSYKDEVFLEALFLKMEGRKLYKYALQTVAGSMKECLDKAGIALRDVSKILIHQANGKMDEAIVTALYDAEKMTAAAGCDADDDLLARQQLRRHGTDAVRSDREGPTRRTDVPPRRHRPLRLRRRGDAHQRVRVPDAVGEPVTSLSFRDRTTPLQPHAARGV